MTTVLYSTLFGSHLYGTNTPTSDLDIKRIVLPDINDLLLCKRIENKVKKTNTVKNTKNSAEDVDQEDIPLQVFVRDFVEGQTYAIELAFSMDGSHAQQTFHNGAQHTLPNMVRELRTQFLTSNVKAMMGYVFNQANIYSFKGERLNCARELHTMLAFANDYYKDDACKVDIMWGAPIWRARVESLAAKYPNYFKVSEYDVGLGQTRPCFILLEKTLPFTNTLVHSLNVVSTIIEKYGNRAAQASESNVDWKAMMHAVRIIDEGLELLEAKTLTLPREPAVTARLLKIKRGELPIEPLKDELVEKLERLKAITAACGLPSSMDPDFKERLSKFTLTWLWKFYAQALTRALSVELSNADGEFDDKREYPVERIDVVHRACLDVMSSQ